MKQISCDKNICLLIQALLMILTEFHGVPVHLISLIILLVLDILEYLTELMILFFSLDSFMGLI